METFRNEGDIYSIFYSRGVIHRLEFVRRTSVVLVRLIERLYTDKIFCVWFILSLLKFNLYVSNFLSFNTRTVTTAKYHVGETLVFPNGQLICRLGLTSGHETKIRGSGKGPNES